MNAAGPPEASSVTPQKSGSAATSNHLLPRLQTLSHPLLDTAGRRLSVWREDLNHPTISGNKWHKLMPFLAAAAERNNPHLYSVGGRYSNHLHALAYAAHQHGYPATAWVRGHASQGMTATLADCQRWGMQLRFISRRLYAQRHSLRWQQGVQALPRALWIPEGGTDATGIAGVRAWGATLWPQLPANCTLLVPVGSGGTLVGLAQTAPVGSRVIAVPVFKNWQTTLTELCRQHGLDAGSLAVWPAAGRGFGRFTAEEAAFGAWFERQFEVPLDPVYTRKLAYACWRRLQAGAAGRGDSVSGDAVLLHTGGLQGRAERVE